MVNTFLVRGDYYESARLLDYRRLGKQRVEAQQILTFLNQLRFIARSLHLPSYPENQETPLVSRQEWISQVLQAFKLNWRAIWIRGPLIIWIPKNVPPPRSSRSPGEEYITTAFKSHPAVRMWLGLESSLKLYINAHIEVWIERGYKNTMKIHPREDFPHKPSWATDTSQMVSACKANLFWKEIDRSEAPWYIRFPDFHLPRCEYHWL